MANSPSSCLNDNTFGPTVVGCRDDFDFTITFEQTILSTAPSSCFAILACLRIFQLSRKPTVLAGHRFQFLKLGTITFYAVLQVALLVLAARVPISIRSTSVASATLAVLDSLLFFGLSALEHSRSLRTSILFNAYLFLTILFNAAESRTLWLQPRQPVDASVFTVALGVKIVILLLEAQGKQRWIQGSQTSPEETSGIFSLSFFYWLNSLVVGGYRKVLSAADLYVLDDTLTAEAYEGPFRNHWKRLSRHRYPLLRSLFATLKWPFLAPVLPRIATGAFAFCQPFFINTIVNHLQQSRDERSRNVGYGLIGAATLIYIGITVSNALYWYLYKRSLSMLRACLVTAIYSTTTSLSAYDQDNSAAVTLMNSDVNYIQTGFEDVHECWANIIEVAIACWLLEIQLGAAFVAPLAVVIICAAASFGMGKFTGKRMGLVMKMAQKRVGLTTNVISNMTSLKLAGLSKAVEGIIQSHREDEVSAQKRFRILTTVASVIAFTPLLLSPVAAFGATVEALTVSRVFTSLAYIQLLCNPLTKLFQTIPHIVAALACLKRVEIFLLYNSPGRDPESLGLPGEEECEVDITTEKTMQLTGLSSNSSNNKSIRIQNGQLGWEAGKPILRNINLQIPRSGFTVIVGPVASGKSTLCKALLGEVPFAKGFTHVRREFGRISYCDQFPFLINGTIRQNIIGFGAANESWYKKVLQATALVEDMVNLVVDGDNSMVGTNGITLSGGQRQRVALARALFSRPDLAIFDGVLNGLDLKTEEHVSQCVFGPDGLLQQIGATVIFCTHSTRQLHLADHIIAIDDQNIVEHSSFQELITQNAYVQSLGTEEKQKPVDKWSYDTHASANPATLVPRESTEQKENQARQLGEFAIYKFYFSHFKGVMLLLYASAGLVFAFLFNFNTVWLEFWSASVEDGKNRSSFYLGIYILIQVVCLMLIFGFFGLGGIVMTPSAGLLVHLRALKTLMAAPLAFFTSVDVGVTTNHFSQDIMLVDEDLSRSLSNTVATGLVVIGQAAVIGASSPYVMVGYPFLAVLLYIIQKVYLRTSRQLRFLELETKAPLYKHFIETLDGVVTIRAFGWIEQNIALNNRLFNESQRSAYLLVMIQQWLTTILNLVVAILAVIFSALATQLDISGPGFTGVGLVSIMSFGTMLASIVRQFTQLELATSALSRLKHFSEDIPSENSEGLSSESIVPEWPCQGKIEICNVSASYQSFEGTSIKKANRTDVQSPKNLALRGISLSIGSGEKVAICGRTGSGKSSLILLLQRFLKPTQESGDILIDGVSQHQIPHFVIRERIITLPQSPFFLADGSTVRENLELNAPTTESAAQDEEAFQVLEVVGLKDLVQERGGLSSELKANSLSYGQKQLFCLARTILRKRIRDTLLTKKSNKLNCKGWEKGGILILDEFNAGVDEKTDELMQAIIRHEFSRYTILCVTHRVDTIMDYDRAVVMEKGEFMEVGKPRDLCEKIGSRFRGLWLEGQVDEG